jgi:hypothetical protein
LAGSLGLNSTLALSTQKNNLQKNNRNATQVLRANELTVSLVAAVPALLVTGAAARWLWRTALAPRQPDPKKEAVPVRCVLCVVCVRRKRDERALLALCICLCVILALLCSLTWYL